MPKRKTAPKKRDSSWLSAEAKAHIGKIVAQDGVPTLSALTKKLRVFHDLCLKSPLGPDSAPPDTLNHFGEDYVAAIKREPVPQGVAVADQRLLLVAKYGVGVCFPRTFASMYRFASGELLAHVQPQTCLRACEMVATHFGNIQRRFGGNGVMLAFWKECAVKVAKPPAYFAFFEEKAGQIAATDIQSPQEKDQALSAVCEETLAAAGSARALVEQKVVASLWRSAVGGLTDGSLRRAAVLRAIETAPVGSPLYVRANLLLPEAERKSFVGPLSSSSSLPMFVPGGAAA